jgi:predicted dehydrogenase/nucleoside-diphosphate-sugar epimerase
MLRVGLVGAGYVSHYHIRALRSLPFIEIAGIADLDLARAQEAAQPHGIAAVRTLQELARFAPDVIHVLTPPSSHCALTIEALDMRCHVLVEKPMASSPEECDRMIAKAEQMGRILSVNHSAKFDPIIEQVLQHLREGAIGDILTVDYFRSSEYHPYAGGQLPEYYRQGGYPFRDLGVHGLYLIEAFLGKIRNLDTVYRSTGRHPNLLFDEWRSVAHCEKGTGQMQLSWNARPMQNTLLVQGTGGAIEIDLFFERYTLRRDLPGPKAAGIIVNAFMGALGAMWDVARNTVRFATGSLLPSPDIHNSVRQFHLALAKGVAPPVSAEEGRRMVVWVEAAAGPADAERTRRFELEAPLKPAPILVTGGTGLLGSALVKRLTEQGQTVRLLVRRQPPRWISEHPNISLAFGDLGDPEAVDRAVQGVDLVYHVGATMSGGWDEYAGGTVCGTKNIVSSCLRHGVKKLFHVSSLSVLDYAGLAAGACINESSAFEPYPEKRGHYARAKLEAERIVLDAIDKRSLPAVVLRPAQIFGAGAERVPPYGTISLGSRWIVMGRGDMLVPLVYVDDVVDSLICAGERPGLTGSVFQIVDEASVSQREFLRLGSQKLPDIKATYAPMIFLYAAATGLELLGRILRRSVPLTHYRLRSLKSNLRYDCTAANDILGWKPRVGVNEGLRRTFLATQPAAEFPAETAADPVAAKQ